MEIIKIVLLAFILLFSSSSFAISLEDGLRVKLNYAVKNNLKSTPNETTIEFIKLYLESLKYKELLELSSSKIQKNRDNLTEAKIKAAINPNKNNNLEKMHKIYLLSNNRKIIDEMNYAKSKKKLEETLHVKIYDVKLPLIQAVPKNLKEALTKDENNKIDIRNKWEKLNQAKKEYEKSNITQREKIEKNFNYRVATYALLATNHTFINDVLSQNNSFQDETLFTKKIDNNIMKLHFKEKTKKQPIKKKHQPKNVPKFRTTFPKKKTVFCYKVNTAILNVRKKHSEKSKIIHRYKKDDIICASKQTFSWIETKHGWVSKDYIVRVKAKI